MIEIRFGIKKKNGYFTYRELMIGKGFSNWGQMYWISLSEIDKTFNGKVTGGRIIWSI